MTLGGAKASRKAKASPPVRKARANRPHTGPDPAPAAADLLAWYDRHRRVLPWRAAAGATADPYRVWLSEIMLQQTTVTAGAPHFHPFLPRRPNRPAPAPAPPQAVLQA